MINSIEKNNNDIYQIKYYFLGLAEVYMYLIIGDDKCLLIDTGYGATEVMQYVRSVTELPVTVVNTHGHMDHIGGNHDFDEVYLSKKDWKLAVKSSDKIWLKEKIQHVMEVRNMLPLLQKEGIKTELGKTIQSQSVKYRDLPVDGFFELGERKVYFFGTPGHTCGSICLYDEKTNTLFTGDTVCSKGVLLGFEESTSVEVYLDSLLKIRAFCHEKDIEIMYPSHHEAPCNIELIDKYIDLCEKIITGELTGEYRDTGTCCGSYVNNDDVSLIYKKEHEQ